MRVLCYLAKLETGGWVAGCPALGIVTTSETTGTRTEVEVALAMNINEMVEKGIRPAFQRAIISLVEIDDGPVDRV